MDVKLHCTERGKDLLVVDGFAYYEKRTLKSDEIVWQCSKEKKCIAKLYTLLDKTTLSRNDAVHCHEKDEEGIQRKILNHTAKKKAEDVLERPANIICSSIIENPKCVNLTARDVANLRKAIYRKRTRMMPGLLNILQKTLEEENPSTSQSQPEGSSTDVYNVNIKQEPIGEEEEEVPMPVEEIPMPVEEITPDISYPSPKSLKSGPESDALSNDNSESSVCDEFTLLGKEVEMKVRQLPSAYARAVVKHKIQTLLFEASIGMYDNPQLQGPSSSICKVQNYGSVASVVLPSDPCPSSSTNESETIHPKFERLFLP